jgi:hypothetical protein
MKFTLPEVEERIHVQTFQGEESSDAHDQLLGRHRVRYRDQYFVDLCR